MHGGGAVSNRGKGFRESAGKSGKGGGGSERVECRAGEELVSALVWHRSSFLF